MSEWMKVVLEEIQRKRREAAEQKEDSRPREPVDGADEQEEHGNGS